MMEKGKAHAKPPRSQAVEFSVLSLPGWTVERGRSNTHRSEAARREPVSFSRAGKGLWKSKPGKRGRIAIKGGVCARSALRRRQLRQRMMHISDSIESYERRGGRFEMVGVSARIKYPGKTNARVCQNCGALLQPALQKKYDAFWIVVMLFVGAALAFYLIGLLIIALGLWLWTRRQMYWRCPVCSGDTETAT